MIRYKIDVIEALKEKGLTSYKIRKEKLLHEMTVQALRDKKLVSWGKLDDVCRLLDCQPGDILERVPDPAEDPAGAPEN